MQRSIKRIWPYIRPYRARLVPIVLFGLGMSAATSLLIPLTKLLTVDVFEKKNAEIAAWIPFAFPVLYFVMGISRYVHLSRLIYLTELVVARVRKDLVDHFVRLNLTFHNSFHAGSGGLISRVLNDTVLLQQGMFHFADLIREPITATVMLSAMIYLDWKLTLMSLVFIPVFAIFTKKIGKSLRRYGHLSREAMDNVTSTIKESLDGVRVIQSFNLESEFKRRFDADVEDFLHKRKKIIDREEAVSPINEFLVSFLFMGIVMYTIRQIFKSDMSTGQFVTFIAAATAMQPPIKKIQESFVRVQQTIVVIDRLWGILENNSFVPETKSPRPFPKSWQTIEFKNVTFTYGAEMVLKGVSFEVTKGEILALVGESGSGKSTIVNLLERFYDPTSGEILIDGININQFSLRELRRNIALVTQDVFLFRDSISRNIHAGDFDKDPVRVVESARLANASGFIEKTPKGFENPVGERGGFLSGGEKQRVSIARAIFKDAPILILDEATSALDSVSELEVQKGLNHLMEGRTAFVIAHRLSTVFNANRILVLKKGEIVESGTHDELLARQGEYHNFFQLQMNYEERATT